MNTAPFTRSQIFAVLWMALIVAYLFTGPRNFGPVPVQLSWLIIGATIFSLIVLGKRFPLFGLFLIIMITSAFSRGGRGRRRW
jgi:hypothetical protein